MSPAIAADAGPAETPAPRKKASRIWRIVAFVLAFQVLIVAIGIVLFSAMGLANDGPGGCGGG
jgi:hypothetical protein